MLYWNGDASAFGRGIPTVFANRNAIACRFVVSTPTQYRSFWGMREDMAE